VCVQPNKGRRGPGSDASFSGPGGLPPEEPPLSFFQGSDSFWCRSLGRPLEQPAGHSPDRLPRRQNPACRDTSRSSRYTWTSLPPNGVLVQLHISGTVSLGLRSISVHSSSSCWAVVGLAYGEF